MSIFVVHVHKRGHVICLFSWSDTKDIILLLKYQYKLIQSYVCFKTCLLFNIVIFTCINTKCSLNCPAYPWSRPRQTCGFFRYSKDKILDEHLVLLCFYNKDMFWIKAQYTFHANVLPYCLMYMCVVQLVRHCYNSATQTKSILYKHVEQINHSHYRPTNMKQKW